jgi:hypothetical protein
MVVPVPSHTLAIRDGGLGLVGSLTGSSFKIGGSTSGTAGSFYSYAGTDVQKVFDDLGDGPLPHAVAKHLLRSNGKPVIAYKATTSTAGTSTSVTQVGTGPLVTLTGAPNDQYDSSIKIILGGVIGTSTFQYSLDGGDTWSDTLATASTYLLPSGVTANFAAGTYVLGTTYSWTDTAPAMTTTNVGAAFDAITASAYAGEFVHVVGQTADASSCLTMATLVATKVASAWAAKRWYFACMEAPAVDPAGLVTSFASFADKGVLIFGGFAETVNDKTSQIQKRSIGRTLAGRIARQTLAVAIARDELDSSLDPLVDVSKLVPDGAAASTGYYDAATDPQLNNARFTTAMTFVGLEGFYPTGTGQTMAATGSDFQLLPYLRIILAVAQVWYLFGLKNLVKRIRTDPKTGFIKEAFAISIENAGKAAIKALLGDNIEAVQVIVNRADKIVQTQTLKAKVRIVVSGYILTFDSEIGLADSLPLAA